MKQIPGNWYESDRFWDIAGSIMFDDLRMYAATQEVDNVLGLTQLTGGASVLDLCCGPGRHSVEFARKGFAVTGVDRSASYLQRARAASGTSIIEFIQEDIRRFVRPGAFDLAINLYTSFGYFESAEDDLLVARNIAQSLKPGGALVLQTLGKEVIGGKLVERSWDAHGDSLLLQELKLQANFGAIETRWTLISPSGDREELGFVVRLYAASEMDSLLRTAGFSQVRFFGTLDGLPYDHLAKRMVVLARK